MTFDQLERLKLFVSGHRQESVFAASNARLNGYKQIALEHENKATLATLILRDLEQEHGEITDARPQADDKSRETSRC